MTSAHRMSPVSVRGTPDLANTQFLVEFFSIISPTRTAVGQEETLPLIKQFIVHRKPYQACQLLGAVQGINNVEIV